MWGDALQGFTIIILGLLSWVGRGKRRAGNDDSVNHHGALTKGTEEAGHQLGALPLKLWVDGLLVFRHHVLAVAPVTHLAVRVPACRRQVAVTDDGGVSTPSGPSAISDSAFREYLPRGEQTGRKIGPSGAYEV